MWILKLFLLLVIEDICVSICKYSCLFLCYSLIQIFKKVQSSSWFISWLYFWCTSSLCTIDTKVHNTKYKEVYHFSLEDVQQSWQVAILGRSSVQMDDIKVNGGARQYTGSTEHLPPELMNLYEHWHRTEAYQSKMIKQWTNKHLLQTHNRGWLTSLVDSEDTE